MVTGCQVKLQGLDSKLNDRADMPMWVGQSGPFTEGFASGRILLAKSVGRLAICLECFLKHKSRLKGCTQLKKRSHKNIKNSQHFTTKSSAQPTIQLLCYIPAEWSKPDEMQ